MPGPKGDVLMPAHNRFLVYVDKETGIKTLEKLNELTRFYHFRNRSPLIAKLIEDDYERHEEEIRSRTKNSTASEL